MTKYLSFSGYLEIDQVRPLLEVLETIKADDSVKRIELTFLCTGGYFSSSFGVYDYIRAYPKPIDLIALGTCQSAAVLVLQAAHRRISYAHTDFLLHHPGFNVSDRQPIETLKNDITEFARQESEYWNVLTTRTKMSPMQMRDFCRADQSFGAETALELGLIDEIISFNER